MRDYFRLMRVKHWVKNAIVFLPLVTSHNLFVPGLFVRVCIGAAMFCLLSSAVYVYNDIMDCASDRRHSVKRNRPIASGAVSKTSAKVLLASLLCAVAAAGICLFGGNAAAWSVLALYLVINVAYSIWLKHVALADIFILASGYALRAYFCSALTGIKISDWLFLTLSVGALFMALGKRRGEKRRQGGGEKTRKVLTAYPDAFLDKTMYFCEAVTVVFYSLWSVDNVTAVQNKNIIFTIPFVLAIFIRYNLLLERGADGDGDPVNTLMSDKPLLTICGLFAAVFITFLYAPV